MLSCSGVTEGDVFWESESVGTTPTGEAPDNAFLGQYKHTQIATQPDGTYSLCFLWKESYPPLPSNYTVCSRRTRSLAL